MQDRIWQPGKILKRFATQRTQGYVSSNPKTLYLKVGDAFLSDDAILSLKVWQKLGSPKQIKVEGVTVNVKTVDWYSDDAIGLGYSTRYRIAAGPRGYEVGLLDRVAVEPL